jgi:hypothetical protein
MLELQRARRSGARESLEKARLLEQAARDEEARAQAQVQAAHEQWIDFVSSPGFSPEYSRVLADRLIESDARVAQSAARTHVAADLRAGRQREWQQLEAQVRSGERSLKRLKRDLDRRHEERRLAAVADQVTSASRRS